ncbi:MAG TPA: hypothetical protein VMZ03_07210 [Chitinophagaceae bacterium]|nr:hypothetical protein [Chitinophagaceae bacterium]
MRVIKLGIISVIFFSLLITIFSFFFPSNVRISKATDIRVSKDKVMEQIRDTNNWINWYPGADSNVLPAINDVRDSSIHADGSIQGNKRAAMGWNIYPSSLPNTVTLQWYMDFHLKWYPWEKFSSLLLEKRYGPLMERGLEKLKALLEQ